MAERCEDGSRQSLQPRNTGKHGDAHQERQRQPDDARTIALRGWKLVDQDGDEDQIIYAEHDLQEDERAKSKPSRGICNPFHGIGPCSGVRSA